MSGNASVLREQCDARTALGSKRRRKSGVEAAGGGRYIEAGITERVDQQLASAGFFEREFRVCVDAVGQAEE